MQITNRLKIRILAAGLTAALIGSAATPARAASKEIIELQTQVQQLTDLVQRLQSTLDAKFGVLQHLAEQSTDNANRVSEAAASLEKKLGAQAESNGAKIDAASGQVQSLNDSVDELKSRIAKLEKILQDQQAQPQAAPPAAGMNAPASAAGAPPLKETFQAALRDYNAAKYSVAVGEFQDVIRFYPLDEQAGAAQFYLGEIAYRQNNYAEAIKAYDAVLQGFPGSAKAPAAQLRKGYALIEQGKKPQGAQELRALIARHPQTPEAAQAKQKLNALGLSLKPSASH
jgi:tol-pal system protein YbgF